MKRKMIGAAAAYMSGLFFASFFISPDGICMLISAVIGLGLALRKRLIDSGDIIMIFAAFTIAVGVFTFTNNRNARTVNELSGTERSFSGEVTDISRYSGNYASYVLKGDENGVNVKVSFYTSDLDAAYGDIITIDSCTLNPPENSYLFASENWQKSRHVFLEITSAKGINLEKQCARPLKNALADLREQTMQRFCDTLGTEAGGFLSGMVFGEKGGIDDSSRLSLYRCGIGHILAVSGLHVSIIAGLLMWIMRIAGAGRTASFAAAELLMLMLIALANYPVSALRAAIMMNLIFGARLFRRIPDRLTSLAAAALLICLCDPYAVYSSGFMLSLSGTFGIAVFAPFMAGNIKNRILSSMALGFWTMLAIMPVSILYFDETSIISPLTNILLVPMCTAAMCAGMVSMLSLGYLDAVLYPAGLLIRAVLRITDRFSGLNIFITGFDRKLRLIAVCLGAAVVLVYLFTKKRKVVLCVVTASVVAFSAFSQIRMKELRRNFTAAVIGEERKCAAVMICGNSAVVADLSGNRRTAEYAEKYLAENGITRTNAVILTRNVNAQFAVYKQALSGVQTQAWVEYGFMGSESFTAGEMELNVSDSEITVSCGGKRLTFTTDKNGAVSVSTDGAYVDCEPGNCLTFGNDGTITRRRL